jgi:acid phosphatase type 7
LRVGPVAHGLGWSSGHLYLHAHNSSAATPYSARFDTVRIYERGATDATAPTVSGIAPAEGAKDMALTANVESTFSEEMDPSTIDATTFTLTKQGASQPLTARVSYDVATEKATLDPNAELEANATYTATLKGGATGVKDSAGNPLAADKSWSITTVASPPQDTAPPETAIDSGPSGSTNSTSATFAFSSDEAGSNFECSVDNSAYSSCASPKEYTDLKEGSHTFEVRATDAAGNVDATPASRTWTVDAASVIMAAGNIACNATTTRTDICQERATSDLLLKDSPDAVLTLGDAQYECGYSRDFNKYYERSWGRMKALTRPILGNHEYSTSSDPANPCYNAPTGAPGYFQYFGNAASPTEPGCVVNCKGYYSYDLGSWHIIALNSVCIQVGGCYKGSPQEVWLRKDLAAHPAQCTLAYWHYPRFSSSDSGTTYTSYLSALWQDLYNAKAEVVLNAHDHVYERYAPMDTGGNLDRANGIREFIVGTGGKNPMSFASIHPNSEVRSSGTYGVLKMTLRPSGYDWKFVPTAGSTFSDSGSESCH